MNSFDEFVSLWKEETKSIIIRNETSHMLFLVVYPDKLKWDFGIEKQTQTTTFMMSGGITGTGFGHDIQFCYRSEVHNFLLNCNHSHAMIVSVGMVFDMVGGRDSLEEACKLEDSSRPSRARKQANRNMLFGGARQSSIKNFYDFTESGKYCKAHIIAHPKQQAYCHHQHMNLNLTMWKDIGAPDMSKKYDVVKRSKNNYHDDYTPFWIRLMMPKRPKPVPDFPRPWMPEIRNFTRDERKRKAFSYYKDFHNEAWKDLDNVDRKEFYFSRFMTRIRKHFYINNTSSWTWRKIPATKFDILFSPVAGYNAEMLVDKLNFDGTVIFYDYIQENINIKKIIVEMNMSLEEIYALGKMSDKLYYDNPPDSINYERVNDTMGSSEELEAMQARMYNNYDIEYWLMDLISPDYDRLLKKIKGKNVYFDASNIFSYHMSHAYYTLDELLSSYQKLQEVLSLANKSYFRGTTPTKKMVQSWTSSV